MKNLEWQGKLSLDKAWSEFMKKLINYLHYINLNISFTPSFLLSTAFINQAWSLCVHGSYISKAACSGFIFCM